MDNLDEKEHQKESDRQGENDEWENVEERHLWYNCTNFGKLWRNLSYQKMEKMSLIKAQYLHAWRYHNETPLYNEYTLIKNKIKTNQNQKRIFIYYLFQEIPIR